MLINREQIPVFTPGDFTVFVNQLTPIELQWLWESLLKHEQFENFNLKSKELDEKILEMEDSIKYVLSSYEEIDKVFNEIKKQLNPNGKRN